MIELWNHIINEPDHGIEEVCREYVDNLTKPLGSLAEMENMAVRLAGITGQVKPKNLKKAIFIAAADAAIDSNENKDQGAATLRELLLITNGLAPVSAVARSIGAPVFVADVGMQADTTEIEGLMLHKLASGALSPSTRMAMTPEVCAEAIAFGAAVAKQMAQEGYEVFGIGQIGERSALSALAITAAFLGEELAAGLNQLGVQLAGEDWTLAQREPETVLARYGTATIAALTGFILGAAAQGRAVVFDDAVTGAAVLAAIGIAPNVAHYLFSSAHYHDPLHLLQMQKMGMRGYLHYDFTLAQGLGSALGLSLLDGALDMLNEMKTFGAAGVTVAEDGPGKGRQRKEVK